jgi:hypothetical protein
MNNVRKYTDKQLLDKVKSLDTFESIPSNYWALFVRSNEDAPNLFDDKCYIFNGSKFVTVTTCTTNKGHKGTGVVEANVWNYDGYKLGLHRGKTPAGVQVKGFPYRRDFTTDGKTNPTTEIKNDIRGFNFHAATHNLKSTIVVKEIGPWSEGCLVFNNTPDYVKILNLFKPQRTWSFVIVDEFEAE